MTHWGSSIKTTSEAESDKEDGQLEEADRMYSCSTKGQSVYTKVSRCLP